MTARLAVSKLILTFAADLKRQNIGGWKGTVAIVLATIFAWHFASSNLFMHTHHVEGKLIAHSHPFSGTADNPAHTHTATQLNTISNASGPFVSATAFIDTTYSGFRFVPEIAHFPGQACLSPGHKVLSHRGPPASA